MEIKETLRKINSSLYNGAFIHAVRRALITLIPLIIIGMFSFMILSFPVPRYHQWVLEHEYTFFVAVLQKVNAVSLRFFSLLLSVLIGYFYGEHKKIRRVYSAMLGLLCSVCFLVVTGYGTESFDQSFFSTGGAFSAVLTSLICCPLFCLALQRFPSVWRGINPLVAASLTALPIMACIIVLFVLGSQILVQMGFGVKSIQAWVNGLLFGFFTDNREHEFLLAFIFHTALQILWFFGIHGNNFLTSINDGFYGAILDRNLEYGVQARWIVSSPFNNTFILMGGTGCILGLILAIFLFSKKNANRTIGRWGILPGIFNISEIISFGLPVVMNVHFLIPFICVPLVNLIVAYSATFIGLVPVVTHSVNWTTPVILSGYQATGSISGSILQIVLLAIDVAIYRFFLLRYERVTDMNFKTEVRALEDFLKDCEIQNKKADLIHMDDELGFVAQNLMNDLKDDLRAGKLFMLYQPQYDTKNHIVGAEALLRWQNEVAGFIYPPLIIEIAKEGGFLHELEIFIFNTTCRMIKELEGTLDYDFKISANITESSLHDPDFEQMVLDAVQNAEINPKNLWIEITEQEAITSTEKLERLKLYGHRLMIDDFGMGHTSITYLQTNLFDVVKLDGSLTHTLLDNPRSKNIITSLTDLSKQFKMKVVAEYVETEAQRDELAEIGCDVFQGYLYSKPISGEDLKVLMKK